MPGKMMHQALLASNNKKVSGRAGAQVKAILTVP